MSKLNHSCGTSLSALARTEETFSQWLGEGYDLDAMRAIACACAVSKIGGEPVWLLLVSGPGNTKTETISSARGAGAHITSTITSEGALLSATPKSERTADATGGLLPKLGENAILGLKDVTSVLSMSRSQRESVLAALREIADGFWQRNVGTEGGQSLTWQGRLTVIGAVTTAIDTHHGAIASMGARFLYLRIDSDDPRTRRIAGLQSLANIGHEEEMRHELSEAFGCLLADVSPRGNRLSDAVSKKLLPIADLVARARTPVDRDRSGQPLFAHAPEAPTRLVKQLGLLHG